jgi:hypothetical protein
MPLEMTLGEVRDILFTVTAKNGGAFTIYNPSYTLTTRGAVETTGVPVLDGKTLTVTVAPLKAGPYLLTVRFEVGGETIINKQNIMVKE